MSYQVQRWRARMACEQLEPRRCLAQVFFTPTVIATEVAWLSSLSTTDVDGDGDTDILQQVLVDDAFAWYENSDGEGTFGTQQLIRYREPSVNKIVPRFTSVSASDMDGDRDVDILAVVNGGGIDSAMIVWKENTDGKGMLGQQYVVTTNGFGVRSVSASDVDGDGDADVLTTSSVNRQQGEDAKITWYENTDGLGTFGLGQTIGSEVDGLHEAHTVDMDGDGDMDVLNGVLWYENADGAQTFGPARTLPGTNVGDVDGDGDMDVVSEGPLQIAWYENMDGKGSFAPEQVIEYRPQNREVLVADVDGDGDADVLAREVHERGIGWYENEDGKGSFGQWQSITETQLVTEPMFGVSSFHATDFDNDGDLDVLATTFEVDQEHIWTGVDSKLISYENVVPPPPSPIMGDSNGDGQFDQMDLIQILQAGKYSTGQPATFEEGDWNNDGVFNVLDIVDALQSGGYLQGSSGVADADNLFAAIGG